MIIRTTAYVHLVCVFGSVNVSFGVGYLRFGAHCARRKPSQNMANFVVFVVCAAIASEQFRIYINYKLILDLLLLLVGDTSGKPCRALRRDVCLCVTDPHIMRLKV